MFLVSALYIDKKGMGRRISIILLFACLLYTSDAADE